MWDEIFFPFPNFNGTAVEVWEWINNFIPHFAGYVIIHPWFIPCVGTVPPRQQRSWHFYCRQTHLSRSRLWRVRLHVAWLWSASTNGCPCISPKVSLIVHGKKPCSLFSSLTKFYENKVRNSDLSQDGLPGLGTDKILLYCLHLACTFVPSGCIISIWGICGGHLIILSPVLNFLHVLLFCFPFLCLSYGNVHKDMHLQINMRFKAKLGSYMCSYVQSLIIIWYLLSRHVWTWDVLRNGEATT